MSTNPSHKNYPIEDSNFNHHLIIYGTQLQNVVSALNNTSILGNLDYLFQSTNEFFVSVYQYPIDLEAYYGIDDTTRQFEDIQMGKEVLKDQNGLTISGVKIPARQDSKLIDLGTFTFSGLYGNYLDYLAKISIYLPFCNTIELDAKEVMHKKIKIYFALDLDNGGCTYYISLFDNMGIISNPSYLYMTCKGKCGVEFPLGSTNMRELAKNTLVSSLSTMGGMVLGAATGNAGGVIKSAISGVTSIAGQSVSVQKGSTQGGVESFNAPLSIMIYIDYPIPCGAGQDGIKHYKGAPLMKVRTLSEMHGFTLVDSVHIEAMPRATETEKREIESLLKSGVILP